MITLYRKYRPQNFSEVVGQNHIKITLQHEIASGKTAHAYLFCGPRGIGKTTFARILAKSVNCENRSEKEDEPCNKCDSCVSITEASDFDMIEIDAASHTGVDNVRENIIAASRVTPVKRKFKVFIIDEVHMLSTSAFNALLKVLEEPPKNVMFILCTTEVHKIPATIISRCERFDFKRIVLKDIVKRLTFVAKQEDVKVQEEILSEIARHSEGHMRDALSTLGQVIAISDKEISKEELDLVIPRSDTKEVLNLVGFVAKKDIVSALALVNKVHNEGVDLKNFLKDLIEILRKILITKINPELSLKLTEEFGSQIEKELSEYVKLFALNDIVLTIESFSRAQNDLKINFIKQLPLEIALIKLLQTSTQEVGTPVSSNENQDKVDTKKKAQETESRVNLVDKEGELKVEELKAKWHEVLAKIKKHNHSLSFILRVCEPRNINGNQICLAFKYKFHKERISDLSIKKIVEHVLFEVFGKALTLESIVDETIEAKENTATQAALASNTHPSQQNKQAENDEVSPVENVDDEKIDEGKVVDSLLKTFGGKVVE